MGLNDLGYRHFIVIHKLTFKSMSGNTETNEEVTAHTNRFEGAWKHAKNQF